ncbi:hypothetical protein FGG08_007085 [Glutinoglossum americanum]|uniref:Protein kinase domain-containing protein n=1 Tax=Glutinoglossum americanum TaxID=1670608 RepID=A0A9P8I077_9PEZI|nr:hypothetical protein FGG08_007085 [Glutinoglossum americanum]
MGSSGSDSRDLRTLLTVEQRAELTLLIATGIARMRRSIREAFDLIETEPSGKAAGNVEAATATRNDERAALLQQNRDIVPSAAELELKTLKAACLKHFGGWRRSVITRVGEAANSRADGSQNRQMSPSSPKPKNEGAIATQGLKAPALQSAYSPIPTNLSTLPTETRTAILETVLLLLLSLEHYAAYSRVLLLYLALSLQLPISALTTVETQVAQSLLRTANEMSAHRETQKRREENKTSWQWKVGLASVAGAALIGVTGGLAAPMVASGIGTLMGGLGLGATAAAGLLEALAGSGMLVGSLFGAYGGRMTGKAVDAYAKEVEDFGFLPIGGKPEVRENGEEGARRLRVTIAVSGWLTKEEDLLAPWKVLGQETEAFALRYELDALLELGNALKSLVKSLIWAQVKQTVLTALCGGLWPVFLLQMAQVVDNPFSIALSRSEKAGKILADALINKVSGERPVTLIGYSLGSRVIYSCLMSLAERRAFGLVESAVFIGSPIPAKTSDWRAIRSVVGGRVVNVFSEDDYILAFLYRTSSILSGVAGLQAVRDVKGVENFDVTPQVSGHLKYRYTVGSILKKIGWEDIQVSEVEEEEVKMIMVDEEVEQHRRERAEEQAEEQAEEVGITMIDNEAEQDKKERTDTAAKLTGRQRDENASDEFEVMEEIADLFPPPIQDGKLVARKRLKDSAFPRITRFLELTGKPEWSLRPRTYSVLRMINRVDVMSSFVSEGLYDISLPYSEKTLPDVFGSPAARSRFLESQPLVLATQAADMESGEGRHRHFVESGDVHFQRIKELGRGGFGVVDHVCSRLSLNEFARKRMSRGTTFKKDKAAILSFERELETLKRLSHHHLVKYVGSYTDPKYVGLIMSPVADSNLAQFLETDPFPAERLVSLRRFYGCLSSALLYLHENKIRHKDIKPMNILVHGDNVLITDFGTSLDWTEKGHSTTIDTSTSPRTLAYCPPEVINSEVSPPIPPLKPQERSPTPHQRRNSQSDIYSLGCVFLDMATVLHAHPPRAMRAFFHAHGTNESYIRTNPAAARLWIAELRRGPGPARDNAPLLWVRDMTRSRAAERPGALGVVERVRGAGGGFWGACCAGEESESGDQGEGGGEDEVVVGVVEEGEDEVVGVVEEGKVGGEAAVVVVAEESSVVSAGELDSVESGFVAV